MSDFSYQLLPMSAPPNALEISLRGSLNEDVNLGQILDSLESEANAGTLVCINAQFIVDLNSCGIREWMLFLEKARQICPKIVFSAISHAFVDQANTVASVLGTPPCKILKFEAPYHCPKCERQITLLLETAKIVKKDGVAVAPSAKCPDCIGELEFESFPDEYFLFLTRQTK